MRQKLVIGNWKMNGSQSEAEALCGKILAGLNADDQGIAVCAPFVYIPQIQQLTQGKSLAVGAQNVADQASGAYTGEVSASMLKEFGCTYAIVGHSERRSYYGETDQSVSARYAQAIAEGLIPVLCIGETLEQRESDQTFQVIDTQLDAVLADNGIASFANAVIAYEPVWAIGTGKTATDEQAQEVHAYIRQKLARLDAGIADNLQILYGGSVKPNNAAGLFAMPDIDGGLIGGASLDAEGFLAIYRA
ncbi:MAG: triose-phosphate isomerase [Methylococcales bacterium]|nr:triose-phosphate isomerase [Methylococcales bacterium]